MSKNWSWKPPDGESKKSPLSKLHRKAREKLRRMGLNEIRAIAEGRNPTSDPFLRAEATKFIRSL